MNEASGNTISDTGSRTDTTTLTGADGAAAVVHLHGAQVTSWKPAGGVERLFLSRDATFTDDTSIRGGIPVVFPQFALEGPLPKHGFLREAQWRALDGLRNDDGSATASWTVEDSEKTRKLWPHGFVALLKVTVGGARLSVTLSITNTGAETFAFTAALHSYLAVEDIARVAVLGLEGLRYRDTAGGGVMRVQAERELRIDGEVDRIYFDAPDEVLLEEPGRALRVSATGFGDVVVWNPGPALDAKLADMEPGGYQRMLCIEAAAVGMAIELAPGERWSGTQALTAV